MPHPLAAPWNLFLGLWGLPERTRAWVTEGIPWTTGGGCLQPLKSLVDEVVVTFSCQAGDGWGMGVNLEDLVLESPSMEKGAAKATLAFRHEQHFPSVSENLQVVWETLYPDPRACRDALLS